jgi:hypothetical protein
MSLSHGSSIVRDGLVLQLDAANPRSYSGTGTTWFDLSGNDNANIINGVTYESSTNSGAFSFDGVDDYMNITQPNVGFSPNQWTICFWINPNNQFSRFLTPNSNGIDQWLEWSSNRVNVRIASGADTNERTGITGTSNSVPVSTWSFVCVSIDNLEIRLYVNGVLNGSSSQTLTIANWSGTWRLGQRGNSTSWYSGKFAIFSAYNRALSAQEIQQNFEAMRGRYGI